MSAEQSPGDPTHTRPTPDEPNQAQAQPQAAEPQGADPLAELQARLAEAQAQAQEHFDALLRARAEAENARRRAQEEVAKAHKFGIESFAESLVPVKDSLEAALAQQNQTLESLREGIDITLKQLAGAFERHKLSEIAPGQGARFDPHQHQAIASVPAEGQAPNTVVQTLQKGYLIAERVLRPALVTVAAPK
ncbi:nucleotide exchange factor GrpE [Pigmentiphaga soli]|uniref:Protein GrpE n=1 Tax=Pigmentiphaga soli TaxID=1007095 RepID=A0ABP8GP06_9BURK